MLSIETLTLLWDIMDEETKFWSYSSQDIADKHATAMNELAKALSKSIAYRPMLCSTGAHKGRWGIELVQP